jgi:hypothetical protein
MKAKQFVSASLLCATCMLLPMLSIADSDVDDLRKTVDAQQKAIDNLQRQLDATTSMIENSVSRSMGSADTSIGGYGELHYNNLDSKKELDFTRFVLFFGHRFSDTIRFHSEVELEHSVASSDSGDPGEVELEQAYLDFDLNDHHTARAGVFLVPVGIINETHEPPTFYGVERNPVETYIIPTTWWEGGGGLNGELAPGWRYDAAITSGLNVPTSGADAFNIRDGRQQVAEADAEKLAYTARLRWTGMAGVELSGTVNYQDDVTQGALGVSATLLEAHAVVNQGPFGMRVLYATWHLDGSAPKASGRDYQNGWYVEPSYKITPQVGVFARYNEWDNAAGDSIDSKSTQTNVGINYWPHENVVLKADIQQQGGVADDNGFNLGIGYQF